MEDVLNDLVIHNVKIVLINVMVQPRHLMEKIDIIPSLVPENQIFEDFNGALSWIKENVKDNYE